MNKFTNSLINMRITKKLENALNSFNNKYAEFYGKYVSHSLLNSENNDLNIVIRTENEDDLYIKAYDNGEIEIV